MLAQEVNRVLTERNWSLAQAEIATNVGRGTIHNMRRGLKVRPEQVVKFARAVAPKGREKQTVNRYLSLALEDELKDLPPSSSDGEADPLAAIGDEIDPKPFIDALNNTAEVGAGLDRSVFGETRDALITGPFRTMRVRGDCMEPALHEGDVIFVQSAETVRNGDLVIATVDFVTPTCKRICIPEGKPSYLEPINGEGIIAEERFVVTGVVKFVIEDVQNRLKRRKGEQ